LDWLRVVAARLAALGAVGAAAQTADAVTRHHWPLAVAVALCSRRARRRVAAIAVASAVVDWWRHRRRDPRVRPGLVPYVAARTLDDIGFGSGLWWGALRCRTLAPLLPVVHAGPASNPSGLLRKRVRSSSLRSDSAVAGKV